MKPKLQFGTWLLTLITGFAIPFPIAAQNRPPKPQQEQRHEQRQEQRQAPRPERRPEPRQERQPQRGGGNANNANRPPASNQTVTPNTNRPPERAHNEQNRPPSAYTPPARNFNNLSPQEKQRTLQNYQNYQKLTPGQRQQMQESTRNWNQLTPEQKSHIKNDVLPKWRQLPPERQRAIRSRLNVLQNMPESARNQHLADPNFTRGMGEEDKAMLRDLAHQHVGGAPEEPHE